MMRVRPSFWPVIESSLTQNRLCPRRVQPTLSRRKDKRIHGQRAKKRPFQSRRGAARVAAHAVGTPTRSARPFTTRCRDRGYRAWARARRALEWADDRHARILSGAAFTGRGRDLSQARARMGQAEALN